jgi:hypothetical protein
MLKDTESAVFLGILFAIIVFLTLDGHVLPTIVAFLMGPLLSHGARSLPGPRNEKDFQVITSQGNVELQ